jgi:hypothetical protein
VIARARAFVLLGLAILAVAGAVACWLHSRQAVAVAPIAEGQPATMSVIYDPQQLLLTTLLAMVAGVLAVAGAARLRRASRSGAAAQADFLSSGSTS